MKIAAVGDVHSPKYLPMLIKALKEVEWSSIDVMVLTGDIINKGKVEFCAPVINNIRKFFKGTILGVLGNEEYDSVRRQLYRMCKITWLEDSSQMIDEVVFIGSRGSLDEPTSWQRRNIPNIRELYLARLKKIQNMLAENKDKKRVLIVHYPPRGETLKGENKAIWPMLSSSLLTKIIEEEQPEVVIHSHTHNSVKNYALIGKTKVFNTALPATNRIIVVDV
ncbi:MAG TPA: hypothetical protein ENF80_03950 [Thermofilum sp.]|nr:hypothetical protein [Thermofilum sp.]